MSKIFNQPPDEQSFDEFLAYARNKGYNLEIATFGINAENEVDMFVTDD